MIYTHSLDYAITSEHTEIPVQTGRLETRVPGGAPSIPREQHTRLPWQPTSRHIYSGPEGHTDTNNKAGNRIYQGMSQKYTHKVLSALTGSMVRQSYVVPIKHNVLTMGRQVYCDRQ